MLFVNTVNVKPSCNIRSILNTTLPYHLFLQDHQRIFLIYLLNHYSFIVSFNNTSPQELRVMHEDLQCDLFNFFLITIDI